MRQLRWIVAVVALVVVAGAACSTKTLDVGTTGTTAVGSSSTSSSTTSTTTRPTSTTTSAGAAKATFLAQGNALCATMNQRSAALGTVLQDPNSTPEQIATALDQSAAIVDESVAGLRALAQPPGDEAQLAAMYAGVDQLSATITQMSAAVRALDQATFSSLNDQLQAQTDTVNAEFNAYGLTTCGS